MSWLGAYVPMEDEMTEAEQRRMNAQHKSHNEIPFHSL